MFDSIATVFQTLKTKNHKALIAYLAAGYPKFSEQRNLIKILQEEGVDILELGVPFSDPIADGPTIQFASQESLKVGTTLKTILDWVETLRQDIHIPIVLMSYLNPLLQFGLDRFCKIARRVEINGLIVPDLIPEEAQEISKECITNHLDLIYLVAPTTPFPRQRWIAEKSKGFLYAVSVTGVTGARRKFPEGTKKWLGRLREMSPQPVCVGFGISLPQHIRDLKPSVDGFVVGSALIDIIRKNNYQNRPHRLRWWIKSMSKECHRGHS